MFNVRNVENQSGTVVYFNIMLSFKGKYSSLPNFHKCHSKNFIIHIHTSSITGDILCRKTFFEQIFHSYHDPNQKFSIECFHFVNIFYLRLFACISCSQATPTNFMKFQHLFSFPKANCKVSLVCCRKTNLWSFPSLRCNTAKSC